MAGDATIFSFGPFELDPAQRLLRRAGTPVPIGSRSLDLLLELVEHAGELLTHRQLVDRCWPGTGVENSALRVYVSALRRVIGDGQNGARYILNEHGRGYRMVAAVRRIASAQLRPSNLPAPIVRIIGRDAELRDIADLLAQYRLVTLVGPGGIGKSTVAIAAGNQRAETDGHRVYFFDLALVEGDTALVQLFASTICTTVPPGREREAIAEALTERSALLVIDNCEHVLAEAAALIEDLLNLPSVSILATSREATKARSETVMRLAGMAVPPEGMSSPAADVARYAGVELFVERAASAAPDFALTRDNATAIAALCRQLDGIPLALELAAGWSGLISIDAISASIDGQMLMLSGGRRTAMPRHRTLFAVLDWSYQTLAPADQVLLADLGAFRGSFTPDGAAFVVGPDYDGVVGDGLRRLAEKSLLWADASDPVTTRYRLLETTRAYARARLAERGDAAAVFARHARYCIDLVRGADEQLLRMRRDAWMQRFGAVLGDVRAALNWAFSPDGEPGLGAALACVSTQVALQSVVPGEFRRHFLAALEHMRQDPDTDPRVLVKMSYVATMLSADQDSPADYVTLAVPNLARDGDKPIPEAIAAGFGMVFTRGDYPAAGRFADELIALGEREANPDYTYAGSRMRAQVLHYLGHHETAGRLCQWVLDGPQQFLPLTNVSHHISMRIILARIAYLQDRLGEADRLATTVVEMARAANPPALCQALTAAAIPVAMARGDLEAAQHAVELLRETAYRHDMQYWIDWAEGLQQAFALFDHNTDRHTAQIRFALSLRPLTGKLVDLLATLDRRLVTTAARERVRTGLSGWSAPEILRADALASPDAAEQARLLQQSRALAAEQGAHLFVARAEDSLSRLGQRVSSERRDAEGETALP